MKNFEDSITRKNFEEDTRKLAAKQQKEDEKAAKQELVEEEEINPEEARKAQTEKERLERPQNIFVNKRQLDKLEREKELELKSVSLYGRVLMPGEEVILVDENMKEHKARFKELLKTTKDGSVTIKVVLTETE